MKPFVPGNVACAGSDSGTARNADTVRNTGSNRAARIGSPPSSILDAIQQVRQTRGQRFRMRMTHAKDGQNEREERRLFDAWETCRCEERTAVRRSAQEGDVEGAGRE